MSETIEIGWNQVRDEAIKREMDNMMRDTTQSRVDEKIANQCKAEITANPTKHRKLNWEQFIEL